MNETPVKYCHPNHEEVALAFCQQCKTFVCHDCIQKHFSHLHQVISNNIHYSEAIIQYTKIIQIANIKIKIVEQQLVPNHPYKKQFQRMTTNELDQIIDIFQIQTFYEEWLKILKEFVQQIDLNIQTLKQVQDKQEACQYISNYYLTTPNIIQKYKEQLGQILNKSVPETTEYICQSSSKYLHYFKHRSDELHLLNVESSKYNLIHIPDSPVNDQNKFASINYEDLLFICGGNLLKGQTHIFNLKNESLVEKEKMIWSLETHALAAVEKIVYCLGGFDGKNFVDHCQNFNLELNSWTEGPKLTEEKCDISATPFDKRFIMAFGGFNQNSKYLGTIEQLDIALLPEGWTRLELSNPNEWTPRACSFSIQFSKNRIIILGGFNSGSLDDIFIFMHNQKCIQKLDPLPIRGKQYYSKQSGLIFDKCLFCILGQDIVNFNPLKNSCSIQKRKQWMRQAENNE